MFEIVTRGVNRSENPGGPWAKKSGGARERRLRDLLHKCEKTGGAMAPPAPPVFTPLLQFLKKKAT